MTKISETGHAKNVANLESLITAIVGLGATYNPSRIALQLEELQMLLTKAKESFHAFYEAQTVYSKAVDDRELAFKPLKVLITRINNALKASDSSTKNDESVQTIIRKLQGRRSKRKLTDAEIKLLETEGKVVHQISTSQMGYDSWLENFTILITFLSNIPEYNPNEIDLKLETLKSIHIQLKTKNNDVFNRYSVLLKERNNRDEILYHPLTGLVDISGDTKTYIKSVFGASSSEYKQISKLQFINHKKYKG